MSQEKNKPEQSAGFMLKLATFIVDRRNLFFLLFAILIMASVVGTRFVKVENRLTEYLSDDTETKKGLNIMEDQFVTYGSCKLMVANINYDEAEKLAGELQDLSYVSLVQFNNSKEHFNDFSALYDITFKYSEHDERCLEYLERIKDYTADYDAYISTTLGDQASETLAKEVSKIIVYVAIIVLAVLLFTSTSLAEIPVLIITFLTAAILAMGSNFLLGTISFVSNSVAIVLQLALSVDYAVIFCNRYKEEHKTMSARDADIVALSKAIPEISASSLTTIGGLVAMLFMQFGIGPDLGIVLIKAIILSLLVVFFLMPGLIMLFADAMEKTEHKNLVPKIDFVGKFAYRTRYIMPIVFIIVIVFAYRYQANCPYAYGESLIETPTKSEQQIIDQRMNDTFGSRNTIAMLIPSGDYEKEAALIKELDSRDEIKTIIGLANTEAKEGTTLTQKLNSREFAELLGIDSDIAGLLYTAYAISDENYGSVLTSNSTYRVPFIDMFHFLYREYEKGYMDLDDETRDIIEQACNSITVAEQQLQGEKFSRLLMYLDLPEEGPETFAFLDTMHVIARDYYGEDAEVYLVGNATSDYDLSKSFARDNKVVTVISVLAVLAVLLFTFKSAGMPLLLIIVIEGCIWINFAFPTLQHKYLFFLSYLVVSSIQMGANIDYAIVVSSRYQEVKHQMSPMEAVIDTMNFAFPTIVTSGTMLAAAGILIGRLTSMASICGVGQCLGRGTIVSIIAVLFVLPQFLLTGDRIIERTSFDVSLPAPSVHTSLSGINRVDGFVRGEVHGYVVGMMHATISGDVDLQVINRESKQPEDNEEPEGLPSGENGKAGDENA